MAVRPNAPEYFWLEPLRVLLNATAPRHPKFMWWRDIIGGSQGQALYNTEAFCAIGSSPPPEWTLENLAAYGPAEVLRLWAEEEMRIRYCDTGGGA